MVCDDLDEIYTDYNLGDALSLGREIESLANLITDVLVEIEGTSRGREILCQNTVANLRKNYIALTSQLIGYPFSELMVAKQYLAELEEQWNKLKGYLPEKSES